MKRIIAVVLAITLIFTTLSVFVGCKNDDTQKKAMILIHGIGEGCLYNTETGEPAFCVTDFNAEELGDLVAGVMPSDEGDSLLDILPVNEDGTLKEDDVIRPANMNDPTGQYVMANLMKPLYEQLEADYGEDYDVVVWQYDWRLSTDDIADKLEAYIADKGYQKIMLFTHSMGGMVASAFFKKEANRNMTELFVPFSTPFYGASDTVYLLYEGLIAAIPEMIDQFYVEVPDEFKSLINLLGLDDEDYDENGNPNPSVMFSKLMSMANNPIIKNFIDINMVLGILKDIAKNLVSLYQLFPNEEFFASPLYSDNAFFTYDGAAKSYDEFLDICVTDEYLSELTLMTNDEVRPALASLTEYQESIMPDGEQISTLVNTFYVQGNGVKTLKSVNALSDGTATYDYFNYGDGLVSVWSGTAGLLKGDETQAELDALSDKVYISNGGYGRVGTSHLFVIFAPDVLDAVGNKVDATIQSLE